MSWSYKHMPESYFSQSDIQNAGQNLPFLISLWLKSFSGKLILLIDIFLIRFEKLEFFD